MASEQLEEYLESILDIEEKEGIAKTSAIAKCLKEHSSELSPACKKNIEKAKKKAHELKEACKDDAQKLCKGMKPGGGKILQCLKQHEDELSPSCKAEMDRPKGKNKM